MQTSPHWPSMSSSGFTAGLWLHSLFPTNLTEKWRPGFLLYNQKALLFIFISLSLPPLHAISSPCWKRFDFNSLSISLQLRPLQREGRIKVRVRNTEQTLIWILSDQCFEVLLSSSDTHQTLVFITRFSSIFSFLHGHNLPTTNPCRIPQCLLEELKLFSCIFSHSTRDISP